MIACAVLAGVGLCVWLALPRRTPPEPVYQGKSLGYWLKLDARAGATTEDHVAAETAFRAMATNAVPFLLAKLERDGFWDSRKEEFNALVDKWHLPANFRLTNTTSVNSSARALQILGSSAETGLLRVFEETSNTNALNAAVQALYTTHLRDPPADWGGRRRQPGESNWKAYIGEQKEAMSPVAWRRFTNAAVPLLRLQDY